MPRFVQLTELNPTGGEITIWLNTSNVVRIQHADLVEGTQVTVTSSSGDATVRVKEAALSMARAISDGGLITVSDQEPTPEHLIQ